MNVTSKILLPFVLLLVAALPAQAEERPVSYQRAGLKPNVKISVDNLSGSVEVKAWDKPELSMTGTLGADVVALETTGDESSIKIVVRHPKIVHNPDPTQLRLFVPIGAELEIDTVSADIRVGGVRGPVKVDSVSGDVILDVASARVSAGTVSGDLHVGAAGAEDLRVSSVSGDVEVRGPHGSVRGETVSGDLRLSAQGVKKLEAQTVSGDLVLDLELAADADVKAESLSGDVRLTLPAQPEGDLSLETFSGSVSSAWSLTPDEEAHTYRRDGKGRGRVALNSFSGDVSMEKR